MKKILTLVLVLSGLVCVMLSGNTSAAVQGNTDTQNKPTANTQTQANKYDYTAKPNDSYTVLARKAIQTYGIVNKVNLSTSQIVFAETGLTQEANSPILNVGQKVSIPEATVKAWIEKAQKLSDSDKQAWNYYVQFVNFNTNSNG